MKERIIQFGEGNFLRGFVDWFVQGLNEKTDFDSSVVVVQPLKTGMCDKINECGCTYHLALRGIKNGEPTEDISEISCISRCINPYEKYGDYLALAKIPEMRFIFSNTTESGIAFDEGCKLSDTPASSYPGKLTQLLYERFKSGLPGFIIIACELIDHNGTVLLECVKKYIKLWELPAEFENWLENECVFCSSLVDRIVTGYPKDNPEEFFAKIGKRDEIFDTAEIFHFWAISGMKGYEAELPLDKLGYNVIFTEDITPYKTRKVRILNGAHTMTVLAAYLCGIETVGEFMKDPLFEKYVYTGIYDEIIPATDSLPKEELISFADAVRERFSNPYIKHRCLDISLNSVSKFKERVLPSFSDYVNKFGKLPRVLTVSFAALIEFYKKGLANDNADHIAYIKEHSVKEILANKELWGKDMSTVEGLTTTVEVYLEKGIKNLLFPMVKINEKDNVKVNF